MKQHYFKWFLIAVVLFSGSGYSQTADEYKIYDAVIRYMFADGITQFDMHTKIDKVVIRDHTNTKFAYGPDKEFWDQIKMRIKSLTDELITDYESKRNNEKRLKKRFDIPFQYSLISDKELEKIFGVNIEFGASMEAWTEYYKLYPKSGGYISLSRVGVDKPNTKALVYFVNWCGRLCGSGHYVLVEKSESGWKVTEVAMIWIS